MVIQIAAPDVHYTIRNMLCVTPSRKALRESITSTWLSRFYKTEGPSNFIILHLVEALKSFHKPFVHHFVILLQTKLEIDSRILDFYIL